MNKKRKTAFKKEFSKLFNVWINEKYFSMLAKIKKKHKLKSRAEAVRFLVQREING